MVQFLATLFSFLIGFQLLVADGFVGFSPHDVP